jgi:hypothetical protein
MDEIILLLLMATPSNQKGTSLSLIYFFKIIIVGEVLQEKLVHNVIDHKQRNLELLKIVSIDLPDCTIKSPNYLISTSLI